MLIFDLVTQIKQDVVNDKQENARPGALYAPGPTETVFVGNFFFLYLWEFLNAINMILY